MIQQHIFASQDVPERFKCQILSFVRIQWPELFSGKYRLRDWTSKPDLHPVTFLLEEEGVLISRVEVVWDVLAHAGETYLTYGLSGVFTYPAFRKQGYGLRLVQSAVAWIEQQAEADLVLVHSTLTGFYEQAGGCPHGQPDHSGGRSEPAREKPRNGLSTLSFRERETKQKPFRKRLCLCRREHLVSWSPRFRVKRSAVRGRLRKTLGRRTA
jgi:GNAT superfamily N-acetyltransferase